MAIVSEELQKLILGSIGDPSSANEMIALLASGGGGGGADVHLSNLTAPTNIPVALLPHNAGGGLYGNANLGSATQPWGSSSYISDLGTFELDIYDASTPSFASQTGEILGNVDIGSIGFPSAFADVMLASLNPVGNGLGLMIATTSNASASTPTQDIQINTGNATGTTSNSGNIALNIGTATGTRGKIQLADGSEGTPGQVWTSTDASGSGAWAPASGGGTITPWSVVTVTGSFVTNTQYFAFMRQVGDSIDLTIKVVFSGAPNTTPFRFTLPNSYAIDTAKLISFGPGASQIPGQARGIQFVTHNWDLSMTYDSTTSILLFYPIVTGSSIFQEGQVSESLPWVIGNNDTIEIRVTGLPIVGLS